MKIEEFTVADGVGVLQHRVIKWERFLNFDFRIFLIENYFYRFLRMCYK